jgi:hypothetical protein
MSWEALEELHSLEGETGEVLSNGYDYIMKVKNWCASSASANLKIFLSAPRGPKAPPNAFTINVNAMFLQPDFLPKPKAFKPTSNLATRTCLSKGELKAWEYSI